MELNKIYNENCLDTISKMDNDFLDLTFTSPPYFNAKEYSSFANYKIYLEFLKNVFLSIERKMKKGSILVINLSCVIEPRKSRSHESVRYPIPFDVVSILRHHLNFIDDIIWEKPDGASNRGIKFSHHRRPVAYKTFNITEYLLVFSKKGCLLDEQIKRHNVEIIKDSLVNGNYERTNIWKVSPVRNVDHPATFPIELAKKVIRYYSYKDDIVYDPFMGSGTTALACKKLNRNFIGSEINLDYYNSANDRINDYNPV